MAAVEKYLKPEVINQIKRLDLRAQFGVFGHDLVGLLEVEVAGAAGRHDLIEVPVDQGQIAGDHRVGRELVDRVVFRSSATVPVFDRFELEAEIACDRLERHRVGHTAVVE